MESEEENSSTLSMQTKIESAKDMEGIDPTSGPKGADERTTTASCKPATDSMVNVITLAKRFAVLNIQMRPKAFRLEQVLKPSGLNKYQTLVSLDT